MTKPAWSRASAPRPRWPSSRCRQPPARNIRSKNIDLIVPYGPGGGFDLYARAVGKAMENHLPKNVRVIVRNIPGAGSVNGIATMYRAAPDGYTMGIVDLPGAVAPQIMGEQLPYDLDKATWLGTVNIGVYSLVVGKKTAFATLDAFRKAASRPPFFATTGSNDLAMARIAAACSASRRSSSPPIPAGRRPISPSSAARPMPGSASTSRSRGIWRAAISGSSCGSPRRARAARRDGVATADDVGHPELANLSLNRVFAAPPGLPEWCEPAGRRRAEGAERSRARGLGDEGEFPARHRHAGGDAAGSIPSSGCSSPATGTC